MLHKEFILILFLLLFSSIPVISFPSVKAFSIAPVHMKISIEIGKIMEFPDYFKVFNSENNTVHVLSNVSSTLKPFIRVEPSEFDLPDKSNSSVKVIVDGRNVTKKSEYTGEIRFIQEIDGRPSIQLSVDVELRFSSEAIPLCGNGICETGESQFNCCQDCGCPPHYSCDWTAPGFPSSGQVKICIKREKNVKCGLSLADLCNRTTYFGLPENSNISAYMDNLLEIDTITQELIKVRLRDSGRVVDTRTISVGNITRFYHPANFIAVWPYQVFGSRVHLTLESSVGCGNTQCESWIGETPETCPSDCGVGDIKPTYMFFCEPPMPETHCSSKSDPSFMAKDNPINIYVVIFNPSEVSVKTNFVTRFEYSKDKITWHHIADTSGYSSTVIKPMDGVTNSQGVTWTPPEEGYYYIKISVDPTNSVNETNETNNVLIKKVFISSEVSKTCNSFCKDYGYEYGECKESCLSDERNMGTQNCLQPSKSFSKTLYCCCGRKEYYFNIEISPKRQTTKVNELVTYDLTITDNHPIMKCKEGKKCNVYYTYLLSVYEIVPPWKPGPIKPLSLKEGIIPSISRISFEYPKSVSIYQGSSKTVELKVTPHIAYSFAFNVKIYLKDNPSFVKADQGYLIVSPKGIYHDVAITGFILPAKVNEWENFTINGSITNYGDTKEEVKTYLEICEIEITPPKPPGGSIMSPCRLKFGPILTLDPKKTKNFKIGDGPLKAGIYTITLHAVIDYDSEPANNYETSTLTVKKGLQEYEIKLLPGWNMLALPVIPIEELKSDCEQIGKIWHYSSESRKYIGIKDIITEGKIGWSYWIRVRRKCKIRVMGNSTSVEDFGSLKSGWNQIGSPTQPINFFSVTGNCEVESGPWKYDTISKKYVRSNILQPGEGYFVKVKNDCKLGEESMPPSPPTLLTMMKKALRIG